MLTVKTNEMKSTLWGKMTKFLPCVFVPFVSSVWNTILPLSFRTQLKRYLLRKILLDYPILTSHCVPLSHWPIYCNRNLLIRLYYTIRAGSYGCVCFRSVRNRILSPLNGNRMSQLIHLTNIHWLSTCGRHCSM